ncbi:MAG: hypothetical protein JJ966_02990 [Balneolaceae bacterium]|nr:hypothetical protein [Balneolaceae bacterium]
MKFTTQLIFSLFLVLIMVTLVQAQPGLPSAPSQAPIDGGLSLLAAAGGAYAIKKLRDKKNSEEDNIDV